MKPPSAAMTASTPERKPLQVRMMYATSSASHAATIRALSRERLQTGMRSGLDLILQNAPHAVIEQVENGQLKAATSPSARSDLARQAPLSLDLDGRGAVGGRSVLLKHKIVLGVSHLNPGPRGSHACPGDPRMTCLLIFSLASMKMMGHLCPSDPTTPRIISFCGCLFTGLNRIHFVNRLVDLTWGHLSRNPQSGFSPLSAELFAERHHSHRYRKLFTFPTCESEIAVL